MSQLDRIVFSHGHFDYLTKEPVWVSENIVTSGEILMTTDYEEVDSELYVKEKGKLKPDPLWDDQALLLKSEKGLVIVSGCTHRGVINTRLIKNIVAQFIGH